MDLPQFERQKTEESADTEFLIFEIALQNCICCFFFLVRFH